MKFNCPECKKPIKLSVEEIQKRHCEITCPSCQQSIELKNNLPQPKDRSK
jgi:transcription elongation factor Elf1